MSEEKGNLGCIRLSRCEGSRQVFLQQGLHVGCQTTRGWGPCWLVTQQQSHHPDPEGHLWLGGSEPPGIEHNQVLNQYEKQDPEDRVPVKQGWIPKGEIRISESAIKGQS